MLHSGLCNLAGCTISSWIYWVYICGD